MTIRNHPRASETEKIEMVTVPSKDSHTSTTSSAWSYSACAGTAKFTAEQKKISWLSHFRDLISRSNVKYIFYVFASCLTSRCWKKLFSCFARDISRYWKIAIAIYNLRNVRKWIAWWTSKMRKCVDLKWAIIHGTFCTSRRPVISQYAFHNLPRRVARWVEVRSIKLAVMLIYDRCLALNDLDLSFNSAITSSSPATLTRLLIPLLHVLQTSRGVPIVGLTQFAEFFFYRYI